jgi:hypothetical protein
VTTEFQFSDINSRIFQGKSEIERGAAVGLALGPDSAAVPLDDPLHAR